MMYRTSCTPSFADQFKRHKVDTQEEVQGDISEFKQGTGREEQVWGDWRPR